MNPLRIIFAGSGAFGLPTLRALVEAGHGVVQVFSQPDRPAGDYLRDLQESEVPATPRLAGTDLAALHGLDELAFYRRRWGRLDLTRGRWSDGLRKHGVAAGGAPGGRPVR